MQKSQVLGACLGLGAVITLPAAVFAAECSVAAMIATPSSVVVPCSELLRQPGLSNARQAEAFYIRGRALHRSKLYAAAIQDYREATKLAPNNEQIWLSWSNADLARGDLRGYVQRLRAAEVIAPNSAHVISAKGAMYDNFGNRDGAMELYSKALEINAGEPFALLFRMRGYWERGKFAQALADADRLVAVPRDAGNVGGYLDRHGVIRDFHTSVLIERAQLLEATGQLDRAAADYEAAVADGRTAPALIARAEFLLTRTDVSPEAVAILREALQKEPSNAAGYYTLGLALGPTEGHERAFEAYDKAIAVRPNFAIALRMRAILHRKFGRTEEAVRDFTAAIEADPDIIRLTIPTLQHAGYWRSAEIPRALTAPLRDAIRACMIDAACN